MNPGDKVASPRSITRAPEGNGKLLPASTILSPCTMITPFCTSVFDLPSNNRAAFRAIVSSAATEKTQENNRVTARRAKRGWTRIHFRFTNPCWPKQEEPLLRLRAFSSLADSRLRCGWQRDRDPLAP